MTRLDRIEAACVVPADVNARLADLPMTIAGSDLRLLIDAARALIARAEEGRITDERDLATVRALVALDEGQE